MIAFGSPLASALNHLLGAEPWARERLAPHAGKTIELRSPPLPALRLVIGSAGTLAPSPGGEAPALAVTLTPAVLPAMLRGEDHLLRALQVEGDARLADEVLYLARHLRWDVEEDLSRVLGDAAAHRLAQSARELVRAQAEAASRVQETLVDYAAGDGRLLVPREALEAHARRVSVLRDALERLEKRLDRLAGKA
jgi:ubiquinone biosynthesis protein UbiJ